MYEKSNINTKNLQAWKIENIENKKKNENIY